MLFFCLVLVSIHSLQLFNAKSQPRFWRNTYLYVNYTEIIDFVILLIILIIKFIIVILIGKKIKFNWYIIIFISFIILFFCITSSIFYIFLRCSPFPTWAAQLVGSWEGTNQYLPSGPSLFYIIGHFRREATSFDHCVRVRLYVCWLHSISG